MSIVVSRDNPMRKFEGWDATSLRAALAEPECEEIHLGHGAIPISVSVARTVRIVGSTQGTQLRPERNWLWIFNVKSTGSLTLEGRNLGIRAIRTRFAVWVSAHPFTRKHGDTPPTSRFPNQQANHCKDPEIWGTCSSGRR